MRISSPLADRRAGMTRGRAAASAFWHHVARFAERAMVLAQVANGNPDGLVCRRIGPPLLFGRLWQDSAIQAVLAKLLADRAFEFPVERGSMGQEEAGQGRGLDRVRKAAEMWAQST
jgi:hypothetical protein